jgi:hypothetical protein
MDSLLNAIGFLNDNSTFKISEHGNFVANFRQAPSPIPPEYLLVILALFSVSLYHPFYVGSVDIIKGGIYTTT